MRSLEVGILCDRLGWGFYAIAWGADFMRSLGVGILRDRVAVPLEHER